MKKNLMSTSSIYALMSVTLATAASALEAGKVKSSEVSSPPVWSGFYAGLDGGYGSVGGRGNVPSESGFIGGGQFGYNYQFNNIMIGGVEADMQGATISGSSTYYAPFARSRCGQYFFPAADQFNLAEFPGGEALIGCDGASVGAPNNASLGKNATPVPPVSPGKTYGSFPTASSSSLDYLATARGRLGGLLSPTLLAYATGGLAIGGGYLSQRAVSYYTTNPYLGIVGNNSPPLIGYSVGGGIEWMFAPDWTLKTEGLYYSLSGTGNSPGYKGAVVRSGINYHLNWENFQLFQKF